MDVIKSLEKLYVIDKEKSNFLVGKVNLCKKIWGNVYTDFLTLNEKEFLYNIANKENLNIIFFNDYFECERDMAIISPLEVEEIFPVKAIKIKGNFKFDRVNHRDYLGSIMALGIKREKIGDINVFEDGAEVFVHEDVADYIVFNLNKIKRTGIKLSIIDFGELTKKSVSLKEMKINVSSLRLDALIASIINVSRGKALGIIKTGDIKINNIVTLNSSYQVKEDSIISIRGYGKFKLGEILGTTKKERMILSVYKYI